MSPYHVLCPDGEGGSPFNDRLFDNEAVHKGILPSDGNDTRAGARRCGA